MRTLIATAGSQLIRRRFSTPAELIGSVYASLVEYLALKALLRFGPFDAAVCPDAALTDLTEDKIVRFVSVARRARGFPLAEVTPYLQVLELSEPKHGHTEKGVYYCLSKGAWSARPRGSRPTARKPLPATSPTSAPRPSSSSSTPSPPPAMSASTRPKK